MTGDADDLARMWVDQPDVIRTFLDRRPAYELLCSEVQYILGKRLSAAGIEVSTVTSRTKTLRSFAEKFVRKDYRDIEQVTDVAGVRAVYLYRDDRKRIEKIIETEFDVVERVDKVELRSVEEFGYGALHYLVRLGKSSSGARYDDLKGYICEIQVRTVLQDAWAIIDHHLSYKQEADVPKELRRKLNALSGLFSTADDQFEAIRNEREEYVKAVRKRGSSKAEFLNQELNLDTFQEYLRWKFPAKGQNTPLTMARRILRVALDRGMRTLEDLDTAVERTKRARSAINKENKAAMAVSEVNRSLALLIPEYRRSYFLREARERIERHEHLVLAAD